MNPIMEPPYARGFFITGDKDLFSFSAGDLPVKGIRRLILSMNSFPEISPSNRDVNSNATFEFADWS
jgi:hypothetical protein